MIQNFAVSVAYFDFKTTYIFTLNLTTVIHYTAIFMPAQGIIDTESPTQLWFIFSE